MGRFGHYVIDADGHGGEPLDWRRRIPDAYLSRMREGMYRPEKRMPDMDLEGIDLAVPKSSSVASRSTASSAW